MLYRLNINDRAFDAIKNRTKLVEIRANKEKSDIDYSNIKEGDTIKFRNSFGAVITCKVLKNNWYASIEELLMLEGTLVTLSSTNDYEEGILSINRLDGYHDAILKNGVYAIHIDYVYSDDTVWDDLYDRAIFSLNPSHSNCIYYGGVSAALLTENDTIYTGVCIDTECSMGMCAERNAISSMITNGEVVIKKLVCVYQDKSLMLPCGVCREFMMQLSTLNKDAEILIEREGNKVMKLEELLPKWR